MLETDSMSDSASNPVPASEAPRESSSRALVRLPEGALVLPAECACCGGLATRRVSARRSGREVLVGYCEVCANHVARASTSRLAAVLASALLAATLAGGLPIVFPFWSIGLCVLLTLVGGLLPLTSLIRFRGAPAGHAARGKAVSFRSSSELVCEDRRWAEALARSTGGEIVKLPAAGISVRLEWVPAIAAALVGAPLSYAYHHPVVRVVNANDTTVTIQVDGRNAGRVEPSGTESPAAGLVLRVPAGRRELTVIDADSAILAQTSVDVLPGRDHLYAPAGLSVCFWLEKTGYGRAGESAVLVPLLGEARFWAIPPDVRGWFVPSPPPDEQARTTGGTTKVLRQGPCDEMPL